MQKTWNNFNSNSTWLHKEVKSLGTFQYKTTKKAFQINSSDFNDYSVQYNVLFSEEFCRRFRF